MRLNGDRVCLFLALATGIIIRSIPNLATPHPIGYDTLYYVTQILDWRRNLFNPNIIFQTPLLFLIMSPVFIATGLDPFTILRIAQPLIYGLLAASFYYAAQGLLHWESRKAFVAAIIFSLQTATLRISWDLLRNELGLAMLLLALPKLENHDKGPVALAILLTLVILSHQMTALILLFIITFFIIDHIRKKEYIQARKLFIHSSPSLLLFAGMLASIMGIQLFPVPQISSIFPNIISMPTKRISPLPFFNNYLAGEGSIDYGQSYLYLLTDVISLYAASYLIILPLVTAGFRSLRERTIDLWTCFCAFASLMCLASPQFALFSWDRWMQFLVVPYTFYATNGLMKIKNKTTFKKRRMNLAIITCTIYAIVAVLYMTTSYTNPVSPYAFFWPSSKYSPPTMLANTAPVEDTPNIGEAFEWLNQNMESNSCLLTRSTFLDWAKIYLKKEVPIVYYQDKTVDKGIQYAMDLNLTNIYWIWWRDGVGLKWYGQTIPNEFKPIYETGNIIVYRYINP